MENTSEILARYRMEKAQECTLAAGNLLVQGMYGQSANRSYYAMFHAIRAVLAFAQVDFRKHEDVLSYFRQRYTGAGLFPEECASQVEKAFKIKEESDYEDFFTISEEQAKALFQDANQMLDIVKTYLYNYKKETASF